MARQNPPLQTFNRGRISRLALARTDIDRARLSAEVQTNFIPRTLGSMMLRPGLEHLAETRNSSTAVFIPFVFNNADTALIELTSTSMRVWVSDAPVVRSGTNSSFVNGDFSSSALTGWTDADDANSTSFWISGNYLGLVGGRYAHARRRQTVTVASSDASVEHGIAVTVDRGRVVLKIGSSTGGDDYVPETTLRPGDYSFAVTPTSNIYVEVSANTEYTSRVTAFSVESSGDLVVPTPWSSTDLALVRWDASADVTFVAAKDIQQRRIERHAARSWGVAKYEPEDGPLRAPNVTTKRLTPSALTGDITLAADSGVFNSSHVGAIFQITSIGQDVKGTFSTGDQWTDAIRVSGVDDGRKFQILVTSLGSTVGTVRVQRSVGEEGNWSNIDALTFTSTIDSTHDDTLDNQIIFYRIGVGSTDWTGSSADTAEASLVYASGGLTGTARINAVTASSESSAAVLIRLGSTDATETWAEGEWSNYRGWPTSVRLHEGRLWWAGRAKIQGSVSDAFESFDPDTEGDAGPINRAFGSGAVDNVPWMVSLGRLIIGAGSREAQAKTNSLEEPLTPTNFALRDISDQGSTAIQGVRIDKRVMFVQRSGTRVYEINVSGQTLDYEAADRTVLIPEIGEPAITRMAVQRQPDTRVHCVRSDGTVGMLVSDPGEDVVAWIDVQSTAAAGAVEDVVVLPGTLEDDVYYVVRREIDGSTKRFLEKWAKETEGRGGSSNKMADCFGTFNSSSASTAVTGADHLVGESVVAWGAVGTSGIDLGTATVSSTGTFDVPIASTTVYYGLPYEGWFKSAKLAYAAQMGSALTQRKKVDHIALILADVHARGLQFGPSTGSTATLDDLPRIEDGAVVSTDTVHSAYDNPSIEFPGEWDTDSRIVLKAAAPRPVTVLGAVITMDTKEKG